jgi:hypothetical protein
MYFLDKIDGGLEISDLNQPLDNIQLDGSLNKNIKTAFGSTCFLQHIKKRTQNILENYLSLLQNSLNRKNSC